MRINFLLILISLLLGACSANKNIESNLQNNKSPNLSEKQEVAFGRIYLEASKEKILENFESSAELYRKALQIDPNSAAAHYDLGSVYSQLGREEDAFNEFQIANQIDSDNYWYKLSYATLLESKGQLEKAIVEFKELAKLNPSQIELKYELAKLLVTINKKSEGIQYLNLIEDEIGVNEEISFLKQRIYLSDNKLDSAVYEIEQLIETYPSNLKYYSILTDLYLSNGRNEEVEEVFKRMQQIDSTNYNVQFAMAEYYRADSKEDLYNKYISKAFSNKEMGIDPKIKYLLSMYPPNSQNKELTTEALRLSNILTQTHPEEAKAYAVNGDYLYFHGNTLEAKDAYVKTLAIDSSRYAVWSQLLFIFSDLNDNESLIDYGKRAIDLFPNQPTFYLIYGIGLASTEQHEKAIKYYSLGSDLVFDNTALKSQFYSSIGDSYHEIGENTQSDKNYEKALELDPNNVYVLNNYSYYLSLRKENLEKAKAMSLKSNQISPNQPSFEDTYAWILFQLEEYEVALDWINKALANSKDPSSELLWHKGDILFKLNRVEEAVEFWKKALEKQPDSEELKNRIKEKKIND
jgi:tetratricopeptide (TPR) repeat protein